MVSEFLGKGVNFKYVEDRLGHDRRYSLNCDKFVNKFDNIQNIKFNEWLIKNI